MNLRRHARVLTAIGCGVAAFALAGAADGLETRFLIAGDAFFLVYLALTLGYLAKADASHLRRAAAQADEGVPLILVIAGAAVVASLAAIILLLKEPDAPGWVRTLAFAGIPLGWLTTHTLAAFHYANLYYAPQAGGVAGGLDFPGDEPEDPGPWDFVYFAFVIGMTAQVSDVQVTSDTLRRTVLAHSVLSFFYYTVIVGLAVSAVSA